MLTTTFWKKYFREYDLLNELNPYKELLDTICEHANVHSKDMVLDIGSGTGNLSVKLESLGAKVTGVDFSKEGIEMHRSKNPSAELFYADITQPLPFPDNKFDTIVSNNVLYTITRRKRDEVMCEAYRVLKPGGRIVISNIIKGFKPYVIYVDHIKWSFNNVGVFKTLFKLVILLLPTIKILYYNHKISKEHEFGTYDFFQEGEQRRLLESAKFTKVSQDNAVYCNQAVLNWAIK